jgi:hypothetical protein
MLDALVTAFAVFTLTFIALRGLEWLYHKIRRTADWSPHWGSWLFAVLMAVYMFVVGLGRP